MSFSDIKCTYAIKSSVLCELSFDSTPSETFFPPFKQMPRSSRQSLMSAKKKLENFQKKKNLVRDFYCHSADSLCSLLPITAWSFFCLLHQHAECNTLACYFLGKCWYVLLHLKALLYDLVYVLCIWMYAQHSVLISWLHSRY